MPLAIPLGEWSADLMIDVSAESNAEIGELAVRSVWTNRISRVALAEVLLLA
jgi:hypothetical protein